MPTTVLLPTGSPGTYTDWNDGTAGASDAAKLAAVQASGGNDIAQNGDGTSHACSFLYTAPPALVSVTTHTFAASLKHDQPAGRDCDLFCRRSATNYAATSVVATGGYASYTAADLGGALIHASEFATIEYGVSQGTATTVFQCDLMSVTITYVISPGSFAFLVASLAGAAVGLAEMAGLSRAIYARERILLSADECVIMYRELREAKNTAYAF